MQSSTILVIDSDGAEVPRVSAAARPFGSRIIWADCLGEGLRLMALGRPDLIIAADDLPGLENPARLLEDMERLRLAAQLVVLSRDPGFDRAMDLVAGGVFTILRKPADHERLRCVIGKALDGIRLLNALVSRSSLDSERELAIYKRLAGSQELGALVDSIRAAGDSLLPGAVTRVELSKELSEALAKPEGAPGTLSGGGEPAEMFSFDSDAAEPPAGRLTRDLICRGTLLGRLVMSFPGLKGESHDIPHGALEELVWAASLHLYRARQYQEAVRLASRDPLTSLLNRRAFMDNLDREFAKAGRHNTPLSLLMIDIDHFKSVNDTFGHQTGDEILKWVARTLERTVRTGDIVCRIGGEEFAALLPWTDQEQARNLAKRFREALSTARCPVRGSLVRPTVSQGISTLDHFLINSPEDLLYWSDQAMYLAKRDGRDAVRLASDLRPESKIEDRRYVFQ
ncbi:MAG: diguanylate cyclase [Deltaproteobacteria bacterium]|jgi:diguanylate cyclase (GGDEF)-like protein|nr:diguanylate cyclase [Deltaproteobacteria bacterium]